MAPFPLVLADYFGHWGQYLVYLLIGFGFGFVLEMSGFGNSKKLAAQFYLHDMTVLKVMFTAIIVAMALIFLTSGLGLLDYNLVWVNPTYLWPGIVGGLIMGVGFIVGGFCPGTSLVAAATAKLDGVFFVLGVLFGIFVFGETVDQFEGFFNSSYKGRYTIPDMLGVNTGIVVLGIILMALAVFFGAEQIEKLFSKEAAKPAPRWRYGAAGMLAMTAVGVAVIGQPTTADRWNYIKDDKLKELANREVQIDPGEVLNLVHNDKLNIVMIDVRDQADYNRFHMLDAQNVPLAQIPQAARDLQGISANTVVLLMSNDETAATSAWKTLQAENVPNVYILAGGINHWIEVIADDDFKTAHPLITAGDDQLRYEFVEALGARYAAAQPSLDRRELEFTPKVKLKTKQGPAGGGCG